MTINYTTKWHLQPIQIESSLPGRKYVEPIMIEEVMKHSDGREFNYPIAVVHFDAFNPLEASGTNRQLHDLLNDNQDVYVEVTFHVLEDE